MADLTTGTPKGLKGLRGLAQQPSAPSTPEERARQLIGNSSWGRMNARQVGQMYSPNPTEYHGLEMANLGVGDSTYDKDIQSIYQAENIGDFRAQSQSGLLQLTNGALKMATTAVTTFLDGTIGTLWGIGQGIANKFDGDDKTGFWQGMWDNDFNKAMASAQEAMEEIAPNYYSDAQLNSPWYSSANLLSANFLGDKLLKNAGFTIGALATMLVPGTDAAFVGKALMWGGKALGATGKTMKALEGTGKLTSWAARTFVSANSEGAIEAINAVNDNQKSIIANLDNRRQQAESEALARLQRTVEAGGDIEAARAVCMDTLRNIDLDYKEAKAQAEMDARDVGNSVYGMNVALLALTNNLEFGKYLKGGFNTQKGIKNFTMMVDGKPTDSAAEFAKGLVTGKSSLKNAAKSPASSGAFGTMALGTGLRFAEEGFEEGSQNIISNSNQMQAQAKLNQWANQKYRTDADKHSLYASSINPDVTEDLVDYMKAVNHAWNTDFGSFESPGWEEVFLGGLTGMLGTAGVKRDKATGKLKPTWQGGFVEEYRELAESYGQNQMKIDQVNKRIQSPEFIKKTRHAAAAMTLANDMNEALQNNDIRMFKNSELMSVVNDALYFRDNGMLDVYRSFYEQAAQSVSDEDVSAVKSQIRDMETGKSYFDTKTDDEIKTLLKDKAASTLEKIDMALSAYEDEFLKHKEEFDKINPLFSEAAVKELASIRALKGDLVRRREQLQQKQDSVNEATAMATGNNYQSEIDAIDKQIKSLEDSYKEYTKNPKKLIDNILATTEKYLKVQQGKDAKKTIEAYHAASTLQEVAEAFFYNEANEDNLNEAIKNAEGGNKTLLESFRPFLAELNAARSAVNNQAEQVANQAGFLNEDKTKFIANFSNTFGNYINRALEAMVNDPNAQYNKQSLAKAIRTIGERIAKGGEESGNLQESQTAEYQNMLLQNIADYLETVSTAQKASAPKETTKTPEPSIQPEVKPKEAPKIEEPTPPTETPVINEDEALKEAGTVEPIGEKKPAEVGLPGEETPATNTPTSGGEETVAPTTEELNKEEESKNQPPQEENNKPKDDKQNGPTAPTEPNIGDNSAVNPPASEEGNPSTTEVTPPTETNVKPQEVETNESKENTPILTKSLQGNYYQQYQKIGSDGVAKQQEGSWNKYHQEFCAAEGIDIPYVINNYLGKFNISAENPLEVSYMMAQDKDGNKRDGAVFLAVKYTDEIKAKCPESDVRLQGNIKETNDGKYLIVGIMGYRDNSLKKSFEGIRDAVKEEWSKSEDKNRYFVSTSLSNKIYDMSAGSVVRRFAEEGEDSPANRNLDTLLNDKNANPQDLTINMLKWAVLEGQNEEVADEDIKYINFDGSEKTISLVHAHYPGKVFMYIPLADGTLFPQYVETLAYNDADVNRDSAYWKELQEKIEAVIKAPDTEARMIAMSELRKDLLFNYGNNIYYQSSPAETDFNTIKYRKGNTANDVLIDFRSENFNAEEALNTLKQMIQDLNPRLNLKTTVLQSNPKHYLDAGLLNVNLRILGAVNAQTYLYPTDSENRPMENFIPERSGENTTSTTSTRSNAETVVYINNTKYYYDGEHYYDANHRKIEDETMTSRLRAIQSIQDGTVKPTTVKGTKYWEIGDKVWTNYKQGGYYFLDDQAKTSYQKAKTRQEEAEAKKKAQEEEAKKLAEQPKVTPKYSAGTTLVVHKDDYGTFAHTIVAHEDISGKMVDFIVEDGQIMYWTEKSWSSSAGGYISETELESMLAEYQKEQQETTPTELGPEAFGATEEVKKGEEISTKGKSFVNGETLEGRKSAEDLEKQANLANFDNAYRGLPTAKKSALRDALAKASGQQVKGLKTIKELLEKSTKEAHALYMNATSESDIDKLIEAILKCSI